MPVVSSEKAITKKIRDWLKLQPNVWFFKVHGGPHQAAGVPDLILCVNGHFVALEVKRPGKKATVLQTRTIQQINNSNGDAHIVTSLDEVKEFIVPLLPCEV